MTAAICDDDEIFRVKLKEFLIGYKRERRIQIDILEFDCGDALIKSESAFDIVFLDYQMPKLDGMEAARVLRSRKNLCCIIFITSYPEFMIEAFEVNTYRFLTKPIDENKLSSAIDNFIKEKKMFSPIVVNNDGEMRTVCSEDIIYLEGAGKYCNIRTTDGILQSSKTLSGVLELLPNHCFCRTHKSYAVNMHCIHSFKGNIITLCNEERVTVSRSRLKDFKSAYMSFIRHFVTKL